jgi:hypothetical protein
MRRDHGIAAAQRIGPIARPGIVPRRTEHRRPHRVQLEVALAGQEVAVCIKQQRTEPAFEQPTGAVIGPVAVLDIPLPDAFHHHRHARVARRGHQQENVVCPRLHYSAGSPTDENVRWTDLKPLQLAEELVRRGFEIGRNSAAKLLDRAGYRRRCLRKELITGHVDPHQRDQQFRHIHELRLRAHAQGTPVLCVDTKKKEKLGHLHRPGQRYSTDTQRVYDHDFPHLASGTLVPHGVYDYFENVGFMTLRTSRESSAFVCDAIASAWEQEFCHRYPDATEILLTFDAGGANSVRSLRFKEDLLALSKRLSLPLRIADYPPYTSKWHPIEHRLFSQVERALRGHILDSPETALEAVRRTRTTTGLRVTAHILDKAYEVGRKCSDTFKQIKDKFIRHDAVRADWNYRHVI